MARTWITRWSHLGGSNKKSNLLFIHWLISCHGVNEDKNPNVSAIYSGAARRDGAVTYL